MSTKTSQSITKEQYDLLDRAYNYFNQELFNGELPFCMIVMSRANKKGFGHFHAEQYAERKDGKKKSKNLYDEFAVNPEQFFLHPDIELMQTIVHEQCHAWRHHCTEKSPRNGYHDKVWARKMEELGLMPSNTGKEGGKKTGQQMLDYVIKGSAFDLLARKFLKNNVIRFGAIHNAAASKNTNKNKQKYSCPSCNQNAWAKPGANIQCGDCDERMEEA